MDRSNRANNRYKAWERNMKMENISSLNNIMGESSTFLPIKKGKHSEDSWAAWTMSDNKSQQALHGAVATPILITIFCNWRYFDVDFLLQIIRLGFSSFVFFWQFNISRTLSLVLWFGLCLPLPLYWVVCGCLPPKSTAILQVDAMGRERERRWDHQFSLSSQKNRKVGNRKFFLLCDLALPVSGVSFLLPLPYATYGLIFLS